MVNRSTLLFKHIILNREAREEVTHALRMICNFPFSIIFFWFIHNSKLINYEKSDQDSCHFLRRIQTAHHSIFSFYFVGNSIKWICVRKSFEHYLFSMMMGHFLIITYDFHQVSRLVDRNLSVDLIYVMLRCLEDVELSERRFCRLPLRFLKTMADEKHFLMNHNDAYLRDYNYIHKALKWRVFSNFCR